jgi:hypothetical protein
MIKSWEDKMGKVCNTHGRDGKSVQFWLESQKKRDHSEDIGIDGRIILKIILRI